MLKVVAFLWLTLYACLVLAQSKTGWEYAENGGFEYVTYIEQTCPHDMVLILSGTFTEALVYGKDTIRRRITVPAFYIGMNEETVGQYYDYLSFLKKFDSAQYIFALPDTTVWIKERDSNNEITEEFARNYFSDPKYRNYPMVGVSWAQAMKYSEWKSDRINEQIMIREGLLILQEPIKEPFRTRDYTNNYRKYEDTIFDYAPCSDYRKIRMEDGLFLPQYRLPTQTELNYAFTYMGVHNIKERKKEKNFICVHTNRLFYPEKKKKFNENDVVLPAFCGEPNMNQMFNTNNIIDEWVYNTEFMDTIKPFTDTINCDRERYYLEPADKIPNQSEAVIIMNPVGECEIPGIIGFRCVMTRMPTIF
jgi:hypothetical protein